MKTVLYVVAEVVRVITISAQAFMPESTSKLLDYLAVPEENRQFSMANAALVPGTELPAPSGVFPRYVEPEA
jgi:methionyl-tRNA synthetase